MERNSVNSNDSCVSTTGTPNSHPCLETLENNLKYINSDFAASSDSSCHQKLQHFGQEQYPKIPPNKILHTTLPFNGVKNVKPDEIPFKEKSLLEMGYKPNEVEGWENIVQPPKEDLYKLLKNMIDNYIKPSVQIRIGEVTFNCHMMVLQCYSDFFMECNNEILIQLPKEKITPAAFLMVYNWMLSPQPLVQREGILELFNAANFLRIKELINQCWLCLDDDVCFREDTAFFLYLEARNYGLESLQQLVLMRICKFFLTLVASKEYLTLSAAEVCSLLSSNTIGVNSEIEIFMSAVRWLNHDWSERERHTLDVVKCVRFSLMPPWFLVTLNKNTGCVEIDRIIELAEVKTMINDGITYTSIQLYYGENRPEFLNLLERFQLLAPVQRQWVYDKQCKYHHRLECPNMENITYRSFLEYLEMIRTVAKDHWRSLQMDKVTEKSLHCFLRTDCRKTTEPNLAKILTKHSNDRGIQCTGSLKSLKRRVSTFIHNNVNGKNSMRRSPRANPKCVPSCTPQINNSFNDYQRVEETEAGIDIKYPPKSDIQINVHEVETQQQERQQHQQHHIETDVIEQRNFIESHLLEHKFSNKHVTNDEKQKREHLDKKLQDIEQGGNKLPQSNALIDDCCTVIYRHADVDLNVDVRHDCAGGQQQQQIQTYLIGNNPDAEPLVELCNSNKRDLQESRTKQNNTSKDLTRISNHKILVFGGIDPYCLYSQHVHQQQKLHQMSKKEKRKKQQQQQQQQPLHLHHKQELLQRRRVQSIDSILMSTSTHLHQMENYARARTETYATNSLANTNLGNFGDHVLYYDIDAIEWRHLSHIPFGSRHHHAVVVCKGLIYVIGGTRTSLACTKKSIFEKSVWCFNPKTVKWHLETNLPESRRDFAAIAIDSENKTPDEIRQHKVGFYVIGGESVNGKALSTVWFYDVNRKLWLKKPSLNMGRYGLAAALVNNEIWVAGGIINDNKSHGETLNATTAHVITDTIEIFNLNGIHCDDVWLNNCTKLFSCEKFIEDMQQAAAGDAAVVKMSKNLPNQPIMAATCHVNCYEGQWIKSKHNLRIPRLFGRFCKMSNGQLYLVGGLCFNGHHNEMTSLTEIDVFNEKLLKWEHVGDLNSARHGHDVAVLNDHCFVVIGGVSSYEHCAFNKVETFCTKTRKSLKDLPALPWPVSGCAAVAMN